VAQRPKEASPKPRSRSPQQTVESLRRSLTREREQRIAVSDILKVISSSPADLAPVFGAILENAMRLCDAHLGLLNLYDGERLRTVSQRGGSAEFAKWVFERGAFRPDGSALLQALSEKRAVQVADAKASAGYREGKPNITRFVDLGGARTFLAVPLLKDGRVLGNIGIYRPEVRPFTDQQIALVSTFADQAVIAIENVRLFNETKEALEQQTAISEVLRVMSNSPSDVKPVLDTVAIRAATLCQASDARIFMREADQLRHVAGFGDLPISAFLVGEAIPLHRGSASARSVLDGVPVHIEDMFALPETEFPFTRRSAEREGYRTILCIPLMREGRALGNIAMRRRESRPFTEKQARLVQMFADQAAIAIENVRLFNETKEALEQQTAVSEVLRVISSSPTNVGPVLDAVAQRAAKICEASDARILLVEGNELRHVAGFGDVPISMKVGDRLPLTRDSVVGRATIDRLPLHIEDFKALPPLEFPVSRAIQERSGWRTILVVPLLRENRALGVITLRRKDVRPFSNKQVALLKTFADQAAIAIENARLFDETKEALERQTATAEILRVISGSPTDVQPVFEAILEKAIRLCDAHLGGLFLQDEEGVWSMATYKGEEPSVQDAFRRIRAGPHTGFGKLARLRQPVHIPDLLADSDTEKRDPLRVLTIEKLKARTFFAVPLLKEGTVIGAVVIYRQEVRPFTETQIRLVTIFADQAVIAIENVRLFNETKEALEQQTAISEVLRVISSSLADVQPVLEAVAERAARICQALDARVFLLEEQNLRYVAGYGDLENIKRDALVPLQGSIMGRAVTDRRPMNLDVTQLSEKEYPFAHRRYKERGDRMVLTAPLLLENRVLGTIILRRTDAQPFTEKQVALLKTFADQAAIAIENVRLFNETREGLERQTATAEILKVIAGSPSDTQPVFDAIARSAQQLLAANSAVVMRRVDDTLQLAAHTAFSEVGAESLRKLFPTSLTGQGAAGKAVLSGEPAWITDVETDPAYSDEFRRGARERGYRSLLAVPMLREGSAIGAIAVTRRDPGPFSDHQVSLLRTFADQAVIAIENTRLFNETKEALEHQKTSAEILRIVAGSLQSAAPVFEAITAAGMRLIPSSRVALLLVQDGALHYASQSGVSDERRAAVAKFFPMTLSKDFISGAAVLGRQTIHVPDFESVRSQYPRSAELAEASGFRGMLAVPLMLSDRAIGVIAVTRETPGPFSEKQIALVQTFAGQAVIAIENARLFNETKEALERQRATSEVLGVISSSPTDVAPVYRAILDNVTRLCEANFAALFLYDGEFLTTAAHCNATPDFASYLDGLRVAPSRETPSRRAALERRIVHVEDALSDPSFSLTARHLLERFRTVLSVPLLREGELAGIITIWRREPRLFTDQQVALVRTFADQAVIAIENARLFKELQERTDALTKSVDQLTALGEVGQAISSTLDLETVLKTIVSRAVQLAGLDGGWIYEFDERDEGFHLRAAEHIEEEIIEVSRKSPIRLGEGAVGRAGATREPVVFEDVLDPGYQSRVRELLIKSGSRAILAVPLLRENLLLGALVVTRNSPGPFAPEVINLLKTFATQSAVAIQNARLFNETKDALEQQKASADVLSVISSSIADTTPVFEKILESCQRLFAGRNVGINIVGDDGQVHLGAYRGQARAELEAQFPVPLSMESGSGAAILQRQVVHYPDCDAPDVPEYARRGGHITGIKSVLFAPMLWEGKGVGAIFVGRPVTGSFSDKEIALLRTFADQAAIAIQNARLFREIQEKSAQLETASRHKSQFLASMSHELRTPLNAILGFNEMLLDQVYGELSEDVKAPLENMQASGKHLLRLINNVLDLAKIEAGRMELALSDYSVQDTVESVRSTLRPLAESKGLELLATVPQDLPLAYGDPGRITQCLMNLAGNSLKFTQAGKVEIAVALKDGTLVYRVADTGIGIPPDKIGSLFTEFKQTDATIASEYGGTGLGLSITKKFIEMHGGRIWVESEPGTGSTFTFEVPLRAGERKAA
jgi:GAF domain-containing protein